MNTRGVRKIIISAAAIFFSLPVLLRADEPIMRLKSRGIDSLTGHISMAHTCDGNNVTPALEWEGQPPGTQSFTIIAEDTKGSVARWIVAKIPPTVTNLPEGLPPLRVLANSEVQGTNDDGILGYTGPCPGTGEPQIYAFTVYALDEYLMVEPGAKREEVMRQMEGHILARGTLKGKYRSPKQSA